MIEEIDIGKQIRMRMKSVGFTKRSTAKMIGITEAGLNMALRKPHLNTAMLLKLSRALAYNFFALYVPEKWTAENEVQRLKKQLAEAQAEAAMAKRELEIWKEASGRK